MKIIKKELGNIKGVCQEMKKSLSLGNSLASKFINIECKIKSKITWHNLINLPRNILDFLLTFSSLDWLCSNLKFNSCIS